VTSFAISNGLIGGKYQATDRLYFSGLVKFVGESAARNIIFCIDYKGRLTIAQNVSIDSGTNTVAGIIRDGESFWIGAGSDGAWNTTGSNPHVAADYDTVSSFETNDIRAKDLSMNLNFVGGTITCEPLIASAQILVKMRKNEETTFTTVATLTAIIITANNR
jgi:hypothetical protein